MNQELTTVLIYVAVVVLVVFRQLRERRIRAGVSMWVFPLLLIVIAALPMFAVHMEPIDAVYFAIAAIAGVPVGWWQQTHSTIRVDKASGFLYVKSNPWGILIFLAAFVLRAIVRFVATDFGSLQVAEFWSTVALFFAVGVLIGMRVFWQRAYANSPA